MSEQTPGRQKEAGALRAEQNNNKEKILIDNWYTVSHPEIGDSVTIQIHTDLIPAHNPTTKEDDYMVLYSDPKHPLEYLWYSEIENEPKPINVEKVGDPNPYAVEKIPGFIESIRSEAPYYIEHRKNKKGRNAYFDGGRLQALLYQLGLKEADGQASAAFTFSKKTLRTGDTNVYSLTRQDLQNTEGRIASFETKFIQTLLEQGVMFTNDPKLEKLKEVLPRLAVLAVLYNKLDTRELPLISEELGTSLEQAIKNGQMTNDLEQQVTREMSSLIANAQIIPRTLYEEAAHNKKVASPELLLENHLTKDEFDKNYNLHINRAQMIRNIEYLIHQLEILKKSPSLTHHTKKFHDLYEEEPQLNLKHKILGNIVVVMNGEQHAHKKQDEKEQYMFQNTYGDPFIGTPHFPADSRISFFMVHPDDPDTPVDNGEESWPYCVEILCPKGGAESLFDDLQKDNPALQKLVEDNKFFHSGDHFLRIQLTKHQDKRRAHKEIEAANGIDNIIKELYNNSSFRSNITDPGVFLSRIGALLTVDDKS